MAHDDGGTWNDRCIIVGSSAHNECIERLWRDVHHSVVVVYGNLFREMEDDRILDHLNEVDIYCLHYVFLPKINDGLKSFLEGWNNFSVSTENHQTPSQMFISAVAYFPSCSIVTKCHVTVTVTDSDTPETQPAALEPVSVPRCPFIPCMLVKYSYLLFKLT